MLQRRKKGGKRLLGSIIGVICGSRYEYARMCISTVYKAKRIVLGKTLRKLFVILNS